MKKCDYCGQEYPDNATVCAIDQQPFTPVGAAPGSALPGLKTPAATPPLMTQLRSLHLYLGCIFAPMLLLFALTGIWQTIGIHWGKWMTLLSSIHVSRGLKDGSGLSSPLLKCFVVLMALAFIITTLLGVVMAVKYQKNRRAAYYCLGAGIVLPLLLILIGKL